MRRIAFAGFIAALLSAAPAAAGSLSVPMDEVRMVTFVHPVSTVYIGNPLVADITVIDSRHVFVLGKAFGATNLIALDANGHEIANSPLTVYRRKENIVTLNRGGKQETFACAASRCESAPLPGDDGGVYSAAETQMTQHEKTSASAAHN